MNVSLYICVLVGISLVFYLLYPNDATYGGAVITSLMSGDLTVSGILAVVMNQGLTSAGLLLGTVAFIAVLGTIFGASAVLPIIFNVAVFFVIPNLFILPTHLLMTGGAAGLPTELRVVIMFILNAMLLMTAIEFWR